MPSQYPKSRRAGKRAINPHATPARDRYEDSKQGAVAISPLITGLFAEMVRDGVASGALDPAVAEQMAARFAEPANDNDREGGGR